MNINNNKYKLNVFNYTIYSNNIFSLLLAIVNAIYRKIFFIEIRYESLYSVKAWYMSRPRFVFKEMIKQFKK